MPATVTIRRWTGAAGSPTKTDVTGINTRANAEDAHSTAGTANPVKIPPSSTNNSFWVSIRLSCDVTPAGTINNLKFFSDGANNFGTGITAQAAKASTGANAGYRQATGTTGTTGTLLNQTNHTGLDAAPADLFSFTSGAPLALTGSISNPNTGDFGDFVVYQIQVASTASPGASGQETLSLQYDET